MNTHGWTLCALLALVPLANAGAAEQAAQDPPDDKAAGDTTQQIDACKQQQRAAGEKTELKTAIKCAAKVVFQSRIRHKKDEDAVEMTVGSPPMVTDDSDTPGDNNWEVNLGMHAEFAGGDHRIEAPTIDINYGIGDTIQLTYEVPYAFVRTEDDNGQRVSANGFGDSILGLKYRFYDNKDAGLSFAFYPQAEFRTPGSSKIVSEVNTGVILPLVMTKEYEHASIGAEAGVELSGGEQRWFASFGAGKRLTDRTAILAEIAGTDINSPQSKHILLNVGLRHKISETQSISGGLGRDVYAGSAEREQTYVTLNYQKLFGK